MQVAADGTAPRRATPGGGPPRPASLWPCVESVLCGSGCRVGGCPRGWGAASAHSTQAGRPGPGGEEGPEATLQRPSHESWWPRPGAGQARGTVGKSHMGSIFSPGVTVSAPPRSLAPCHQPQTAVRGQVGLQTLPEGCGGGGRGLCAHTPTPKATSVCSADIQCPLGRRQPSPQEWTGPSAVAW